MKVGKPVLLSVTRMIFFFFQKQNMFIHIILFLQVEYWSTNLNFTVVLLGPSLLEGNYYLCDDYLQKIFFFTYMEISTV